MSVFNYDPKKAATMKDVIECINDHFVPNMKQELEELRAELQIYKGLATGADSYNKVDYISQYLQLLYQAQSVDHRVDKEIDDALKQFKTEAGI